MSGDIAGAVVGFCSYVAVGLAVPSLHPLRHVAAALLFVVAIIAAAKYV